MTYAELEIDLQRVQADAYRVDLRFTDPEPTKEADREEGEKPWARASPGGRRPQCSPTGDPR